MLRSADQQTHLEQQCGHSDLNFCDLRFIDVSFRPHILRIRQLSNVCSSTTRLDLSTIIDRIAKLAILSQHNAADRRSNHTLTHHKLHILDSCADSAALKSTVEKSLEKRFSYPAKVIISDTDSVRQILKNYPFDSSKSDDQHYVVFLSENVIDGLIKAVEIVLNIERVAPPGNKVIYWTVEKGMTLKQSEFGKMLSKVKFKDINTVRNINTLRKILR
jgi:uncharacterized protein (DUF1697 family)